MPLTKPTKPSAITSVPTPVPLRTDRANFAARGDAMMGWFPGGIAGVNTAVDYVDAAADYIEEQANTATTQATAAAASNTAASVNAAAAAASAGASLWVTGSTYSAGAVRYSPTDFQTYRDTTGGLSSTDPAADTSGRWISAMLPSAEAIALPDMLPTAVFNFSAGQIDRRFVQARATAKTRRNIFGNLESVAAGVALPDFDPVTKRCLGYRSEPAATYLPMYSTAMDNGTHWLQTNVTVTPAAAVGLDGLMSAYKVEATTSATTNFARSTVATSSTQYFTLRVKKGSGATDCNNFVVYSVTGATLLADLVINYDTGVITQTTGSGATAVMDAQGFWRVRVPLTSGITIGDTLNFYVGFSGGPETAGEHAYVTCVDVADQPDASHYPTTGSSFPRGADQLTLDLTAHTAIVNPLEHTIVCAFDGSAIPAAATDHMIVNLSGNSGAEQVRINVNTGVVYAQAITGSSTVASLNLGAVISGRNVVAFSVAANSFAAVARGGTLVTDTSGAVPAITSLGAGCNPASSGSEPNAHIEILATYPRACTAGELRALVNNF